MMILKCIQTVASGLAVLLMATTVPPATAESLLERGNYLVNGIANCGNCHSPQAPDGSLSGPFLSGGQPITGPGFTAYPPNLTPDPETGLGRWTEDQIVTAMREGHTPEGKLLRPPMPITFYRGMSDRDAHAIAVYLRSLPATRNEVPQSRYDRPMLSSYGGPVGPLSDPDRADKVVYGRYLAQIGHCMLCHTPPDASGRPDLEHRTGAGGRVLHGVFGEVVAPNITPDVKDGIGGWTDQQLRDALTRGIKPDGALLSSPMPWRYLATMRAKDIDALIAYLRTLRAVQ